MLMNTSTVTEFILLGIPFFPDLHRLFFVVGLFMYIVTIAGNGIIPILVASDRRLQTPMYIFLSNLACLEIFYTTTVVPKMLQTLLESRTSICFHCCMAQSFFHYVFGATELFILTAMSFDHYLAICKPLQYPMIMTNQVCIQMSMATWYGGFITMIFIFAPFWCLPFCGPNIIDHFYCDMAPILNVACADTSLNQLLLLACCILFVLMTLILNTVSYILIISTILRIPSAVGRKKAFSTCASHLIVVYILYGALLFIYMRTNTLSSPRITRVVAILNTTLTPMLNPFIYMIRNAEVKAVIKHIIPQTYFKKQKQKQQKKSGVHLLQRMSMEKSWKISLVALLSAHLHWVSGLLTVKQSPPLLEVSEGQNTTLTCSVSMSDLYWYQQLPGEKPTMLMHVFGSGRKHEGKHFMGQFYSQKREGYLYIIDAQLEQGANYLCAEEAQ
ncbi:olfactory receptor 6X1-like [Hemicordylus capensis]|uniref:olfactory receptor 6X1-like n=1 Tax=Hemicordylus capensis TaxID=884348 RepID=UPI0023025576|nr:olfactory receptor 6X1-like [Hemicordylus capensis]